MKTDTTTLIASMYELARTIRSDDSVANAEILEAAERLGLQHAEIARLTKQNEAYAGLSKAREWQLSFHRAKADEYRVAVDSLESERAANAHLTAEVARMTAECDMLKGEAAVLKILLRDADEVLAVVEADDCDEDESMMKLRMAIAGAIAHKLPCGECHLQDGERCDICGAMNATDIRARGSQ